MAGSKYAYVKNYELPDNLLPGTFMIMRIDGHGFHRFSTEHSFAKPNDERALRLMDCAAQSVMDEYKDIVLAFGESDEYSFLFRKDTKLYNRRQTKLLSLILSLFTSSYIFHWPKFFPDESLNYPPSFDARIVLYPSAKEVRDYFAWRQVDISSHQQPLQYRVLGASPTRRGKHDPSTRSVEGNCISSEARTSIFPFRHQLQRDSRAIPEGKCVSAR